MRAAVGAVAVLGLAVAVAGAQPTKERAAALKAPQPLSPDELPLARGAADSFPTTVSGTPVARPAGPAWLATDADVSPAGGILNKSGAIRSLTPPVLGKDEKVPPPPKMLDRLKPGGEKDKAPAAAPPATVSAQPQPTPAPAQASAQPQAPAPSDRTAFRGTGTNGAPVFAGPPAYRWYGWGSVTPGANPLAPAGQYPKASANWYQITGATPGAFPVPVSGTARTPAGVEPPTYGLAPRTPAPTVAAAAPVTVAAPPPAVVERPEPTRFAGPPESKFAPGVGGIPPSFAPPAVPVPALTPPPMPKAAAISPTLPPPSAPVVVAPLPPAPPAALAIPPKAEKAEPVSVLPPTVSAAPVVPTVAPVPVVVPPAAPSAPAVLPAAPVAVAPPTAPAAPPAVPVEPKPVVGSSPAALPASLTAEQQPYVPGWKQSKEPAARPGTWAPANAPAMVPLPTVPPEPPAGWQTGRANAPTVVARGQVGDTNPDPIDALIRQICQGRATDVEVRHTGTKKIQVCFETRTADEAKKLVADISRRPELTSYQIDFCVLVK